MEFYSWFYTVENVTAYCFPDVYTLEEYIEQMRSVYMVAILVTLGICIIGLLFGGVGLMKLSKKEGQKKPWLGFLPFTNTYYAGKIAGESHFFGQKMKRAGLYAMLAEIVSFTLLTIDLAATVYSISYLEISTVTDTGTYVAADVSAMPAFWAWVVQYQIFYYLGSLASLVAIVFLWVMFTALFRKYYARNPILMTFLCAFLPFRGITLFAVRKNAPVDYNEYMRRRMEEYSRRNPYGPGGYGGGSNGGGYYGGNYNGGYNGGSGGGSEPDPFDDFPSGSGTDGSGGGSNGGGDSGGSPFDDF